MDNSMQRLAEFKKELDKISPTFCVAKWKQVTMHLESGLTHSCHHPKAHIVPLEELNNNVSALHNTLEKKNMRRQMLLGEIVNECEYCNRIEKNSKSSFSDRIYKSHEPWAKKYIPEIISNPFDYDVFPSYFEVSFSSACNCSCIYCSPTFSSGWVKEIEKYGQYNTSISTRSFGECPPPKYMNKAYNPYIEAFWKWWPELYQNLEYFRITGGEPLLSKDTFKIFDYIIENPRVGLNLSINSNFCIKESIFNKFIEKAKLMNDNQKIDVFTSCEAYGEKANYIRPGMDYDKWLKNCRIFLQEIPNGNLIFMCTYNVLSVSSFTDFLKDVLKLKQEFRTRVMIDIPFLLNPPYLKVSILTKDFVKYVEESITYMYKNPDVSNWFPLSGRGFWDFEPSKLVRIYNTIKSIPENYTCKVERIDFVKFIDQHDSRYNSSFLEIFPEYSNFYNYCKEL